jgi:hypothetical protein
VLALSHDTTSNDGKGTDDAEKLELQNLLTAVAAKQRFNTGGEHGHSPTAGFELAEPLEPYLIWPTDLTASPAVASDVATESSILPDIIFPAGETASTSCGVRDLLPMRRKPSLSCAGDNGVERLMVAVCGGVLKVPS